MNTTWSRPTTSATVGNTDTHIRTTKRHLLFSQASLGDERLGNKACSSSANPRSTLARQSALRTSARIAGTGLSQPKQFHLHRASNASRKVARLTARPTERHFLTELDHFGAFDVNVILFKARREPDEPVLRLMRVAHGLQQKGLVRVLRRQIPLVLKRLRRAKALAESSPSLR